MTFVQIVECKTNREQELEQLMDQWAAQTQGKRTATHATVGRDRSDATHIVEIVEFPSYEEAMKNSNLPETNRVFEEMVKLCEEPPRFTDLDVVQDRQLNKATARRLFDEFINERKFDVLDEVLAADHVDHDPANPQDLHGIEASRRSAQSYVEAFDMRIEINHQMAEGDGVVTAWTAHGRHVGEYQGMAPTGKEVTVTGSTACRFGTDGKIRETWWHWDTLGLLRQLGVVQV